jgi:hypothetical protein
LASYCIVIGSLIAWQPGIMAAFQLGSMSAWQHDLLTAKKNYVSLTAWQVKSIGY